MRASAPVPEEEPAWFRAAIDAMVDLVSVQRAVRDAGGQVVDFEIRYSNRATRDVAGRGPAELTGQRLRDVYPNIGPIVEQYAQVVETGSPLFIEELPYRDVIDGRPVSGFFALQVVPFGDGVLVVSRDVSREVQARRSLEDTNERFEAAQQLARMGTFTYDHATQTLWLSDELRRIMALPPEAPPPTRDELVRQLFATSEPGALDAFRTAVRSGSGPVVFETTLPRHDGVEVALLVHVDLQQQDGVAVGMWGTVQDITKLRSTEALLVRAERSLEAHRELIDQFQGATLAPVPDVPGVVIEATYFPSAGSGRFGGDWYDAFVLDEQRVGLAVGDVSGHGIAAVAAMAQLRNVLRAYAYDEADPARTLDRLSEYVRRSDLGDLATVLYGTYERRRHLFRWSQAGHPPPVVVHADGSAEVVERRGRPPVGFGRPQHGPEHEHETVLPPGSLLVLYTDGLIERRGTLLDEGLARLVAAAQAAAATGEAGTCGQIRDACVDDDHEDDICILTLRVTGDG